MIPARHIALGFALALAAGKAANCLIYLSSSPASATVDAGCSVGAVGSADPRPDAGASAYMDARSRTDGPTPSAPDRLLSAIEFVESRGRADAVGDGGRAVGVLQIWPITVADANRILGRDEFTLADRLNPDRSRQIFYVITNHYSAGCSDEVKARRWNSGPTGDRKACSLDYWRRVQAAMNAAGRGAEAANPDDGGPTTGAPDTTAAPVSHPTTKGNDE